MKKSISSRLLIMLAMLLGALPAASAADRFYADAVNIEPGETRTIAFSLDNSMEFFGFQADINLPEGLEIVQVNGKADCTLSSRANSSYALVSNQLSTGVVRVGAFSTDHTAISGNSGVLLYVNVHASDSFNGGTMSITDILFTNSANSDVSLPDYTVEFGTRHNDKFYIPDFKIAVGETKEVSIILDNETPFTAFQTDIYLPEGLTIVANSPAMTQRGSDHTLSAKAFSDGRVRLACLSLNNSVFTGNEGALVTLQITATKDVAETCVIEMKNQRFSMANAKEYVIPNSITNVTTERALVESIAIDPSSTDIVTGETLQLTAEVLPTYASTKDIEWTSADPTIATVNADGLVTGVAPGETVVTASAVDGSGVTATCAVKVSGVPVSAITLNRTSGQLKVTESLTLTATVQPTDAYDKTLTWSSSDPSVATVENGVVTAVKEGQAEITVTSVSNPEVSAVCGITVIPTPVSAIELNTTEVTLEVGQQAEMTATVSPATATDKGITWRSADEQIASVTETGIVTAVSLGTTTIFAEATDGSNVSAGCTVKVVPTIATGITITPPAETSFKVGESIELTATVMPENATDKSVVWSVSDEAVATVDSKGVVTAKSIGEVTVKATNSAGMSDEINLSVIPTLAESLSISPTSASLKVGESLNLNATVSPSTTTNKTISWVSSNPEVATVDSEGHVKALSIGETTITATTADGSGVNAGCRITVVPTPVESIKIVYDGPTVLKIGQTAQLATEIYPETATDKSVTWTSQTGGMTVDGNGFVTAVAEIKDNWISAETGNGKIDYIYFDVVPNLVEEIELSAESNGIKVGETTRINAVVHPENATNKTLSWDSNDDAVATVDRNGVVTGVSVGQVDINARATDGSGVIQTIRINVVETPVESVSITAAGSTTMKAGQKLSLEATVLPETATDKTVVWSSSDEGTAVVDKDGIVTAIGVGNATITATSGNASANIGIVVEKTFAESISLNRTTGIMKVGTEMQLTAIVSPETTTDKALSWESTDTAVATVDENGNIKAVALGQCDIVVKTKDGSDLSASCHIQVDETAAESVKISPEGPFTLQIGEVLQLNATVLPESATDKSVTWMSQSGSVKVDGNGMVTAISPVENNWIMATNSAGQTDIVYVTVSPRMVSSIELDKTEVTLRVGEHAKVTAKVLPEDATDKTVEWSSLDTDIASVTDDGDICGNAIGNTQIKVMAMDGSNISSVVEVHVVPTLAESISIIKPASTEMHAGETLSLSATVLPEDATDKSVVWTSSDESVATVSSNGIVTAIKVGHVVIKATNSGNQSDELELSVIPTMAESIVLNRSNVEFKVGESLQLTATVSPATTTYKSLRWESSNSDVVTVDGDGNITAVSLGEAVVSAFTTDGSNLSVSCNVKVVPTPVESVKIVYDGPTTLKIGETAQLSVKIYPETATDKSISWTSQTYGMTVDENGLVTAMLEVKDNWIMATASNGVYDYIYFNVHPNPVERIELSTASSSIKVGETTRIYAVVLPENASNKKLSWDSNDESIATVDQNGVVTGVSVGQVDINARATDGSGVMQTIRVNVIETPVESISITANGTTTLKDGETVSLSAYVFPVSATNQSVTWKSDNEAIATVADGIVTAHSQLGVAHITAVADNGVSGMIEITVVETPVESVTIDINDTDNEIFVGESLNLKVSVLPVTATNSAVMWSVSDESIISVDNKGVVTALKPGQAYVYAESADGIKGSQLIIVKPILVERIEIPERLVLDFGETYQFNPKIYPENASIKVLRWSTTDAAVASVRANNSTLQATGAGSAIVTCYATDGSNVMASCEVEVIRKVKSVSLNEHDIKLKEQQNFQLIASVEPIDAKDYSLGWSSSDEKVATVDENGLVEALSKGETIITVTTYQEDSYCSDECRVTVEEEVSGISCVSFDDVKIKTDGSKIIIENLPAGKMATLYDISGVVCSQQQSNGSDIIFKTSPNRIYIVSVGSFSLKVSIP